MTDGQRVQIYWNRHRKLWSVRDKATRLIVGHALHCELWNCTLHVSKSGLARFHRTGHRTNFAWIEGDWRQCVGYLGGFTQLVFHPGSMSEFQTKRGKQINEAARCRFESALTRDGIRGRASCLQGKSTKQLRVAA